jgi:hypothetical protein
MADHHADAEQHPLTPRGRCVMELQRPARGDLACWPGWLVEPASLGSHPSRTTIVIVNWDT